MTKPKLDAAALDRIESGELGVGPYIGEKLLAQSRLALSQAERIATLEAHAATLRDALEAAPILIREPGEYGRPWLPTDHVGTTFEHWDGWYQKRNAALAASPAQSLAALKAEVLERALRDVDAQAQAVMDAANKLPLGARSTDMRAEGGHAVSAYNMEKARACAIWQAVNNVRALAAQEQEVKP